MATQVQHRRGTLAENNAFTGAAGEIVFITDTDQIAIHDGSTQGGFIMPQELDVVNDYFGYASASGTDTITMTVLAGISAYQAGQTFTFKAAATNTGSVTLNVNSLGAKTIKKKVVSDTAISNLEAGDIIIGGIYTVRYDGTDFQLIDSASGGGGAWELLASETASSDSSIDFTSGITSDYIAHRLIVADAHPATDNVDAWLRTDANGGASFDTSGYESAAEPYGFNGANANTYTPTPEGSAIELNGSAPTGRIGTASGEGFSADIFLNALAFAGTYKLVHWKAIQKGTTAGNPFLLMNGVAGIEVTGARDAFQFRFSSGNIATGEFRMYGLKAA